MGPYQQFSFLAFFLCQIGWINNEDLISVQKRPVSFLTNEDHSFGQVSPCVTIPVILISSLIAYNFQIQSVIKSAAENDRNSKLQINQTRLSSSMDMMSNKIISSPHKVDFARMSSAHQLVHSQCPTNKQLIERNKYADNRRLTASFELFYALAKVLILIILKIAVKYYTERHLLGYVDKDSVTFKLIDLLSKALTIAIAKYAIKWALYAALRTASKTFLIALLKALFKPLTNPLVKGSKNTLKNSEHFVVLASMVKCVLSLAVKVVIKTIVLKLLVFYFENEATRLNLAQLMCRVAIIIFVKTCAKKLCKWVKNINESKENPDTNSSAPVNKTLMFALQKLVTKLVKIPLIKILL